MFGAAASANAQQQVAAFSCIGNAGVPPIVRAEGLTELVGDLVLNCNGGTPTASGAAVPQTNVQIFLNTNVTSRLQADPWSEALLMIDEPGPAAQRYCTVNGGCAVNGVGIDVGSDGLADGVDYDQTTSSGGAAPNVFMGRQSGANSLLWQGVPIDPPGTTATRIIRITNVRANANQLGVSSTLIPTQIVMFISATGTTSIPINNPQQTVAFIQPGLSFSVRQVKSSYLQCVSWNRDAATDNSKAMPGSATSGPGAGTVVRYSEGFASSFKRRNVALPSSHPNADESAVPTAQNTPGAIYNTESGFYNPSPVLGGGSTDARNLSTAGLADHGTRLMARFNNIPAGMALYVSAYTVGSSGDACAGLPCITTVRVATTASATAARLITTDSNGGGAFSRVITTNTATNNTNANNGGGGSATAIPTAPITLSNGAGTAVWEVMNADPLTAQTYEFAVAAAYVANTSNNLPGLGTATVAGSFAPLSTVTTASGSAPIPRFADTSVARNIMTVSACTTNLLFQFLTNQAGFDSGFAISNTSTDPFGTAPQSGPCKLNYYGGTTGGGAAPAAQTSAVVPSGAQLVAVLSSGGNYGIAATPGFQGYMIAQCSFQYAHGFAFISDVGANRVSESYQALVLDSSIGSRTIFFSEVLGH
ncbi:MAG: hypothetical protein FJW38_26675 [Acidobacteria bacterium]|nr:hypothetical protein [Acidobacteriota bacterium]